MNDMWYGLFFYGGIALLTGVFADLSVRKGAKGLGTVFGFFAILFPSIIAGLRYGSMDHR